MANPSVRHLLLAASLSLALAGCTATVQCPADTGEGRPVFLLDHEHHATLILSDSERRLHRYGYGDWRYYAEGKTGFWQGARALFLPSQGALGRQIYEVEAPTAVEVDRSVRVVIAEIHTYYFSPAAVDALRRELDSIFDEAAKSQRFRNPRRDLEFVPHPRTYWLGYNSNHAIADWLTALGCKAERTVGFSMGIEE